MSGAYPFLEPVGFWSQFMSQSLSIVAEVAMSPQAQPAARTAAIDKATDANPVANSREKATIASPETAAQPPPPAPEYRAFETGFLYKEVTLAHRARAQILSAEPNPTTRGWRLALKQLTDTLQQMERAIDTAQMKPPAPSPGLVPMSSPDVVNSAGRMAAYYQEQDKVSPHPSTSDTGLALSALAHGLSQGGAPVGTHNPSTATLATPSDNPFFERQQVAAARAAAEPDDSGKQQLAAALSGYAQSPDDAEKAGDR